MRVFRTPKAFPSSLSCTQMLGLSICFLVLTTLACGLETVLSGEEGEGAQLASSPEATSDMSPQAGSQSNLITPTATVNSPSTEVSLQPTTSPPTATARPDNTLRAEWTIQTGKLDYIGVAADGTIYGVGGGIYAVFDSSGTLISTSDVNSDMCRGFRHSGVAGDPDSAAWWSISTDGTFYTSAGCVLRPNQPNSIDDFSESGGVYLSYAVGERYRIPDSIPNGFRFNNFFSTSLFPRSPFWLNYWLEESDLKINDETARVGYINNEGVFIQFQLPEILPRDFEFGVTPWGDTYFEYELTDALGNSTGTTITRIRPDGREEMIEEIPELFYGRHSGYSRLEPITYLPETAELFFMSNNRESVLLFDTDFTLREIYKFPDDSHRFSLEESFAIGNDGNLYFWNLGINELTKYIVPPS